MLFVLESTIWLGRWTIISLKEVVRESATHSWLWLKIDTYISKPTRCKDYPCDLLIVIVNANCTRNWRHVNWKGNSANESNNEMRGMKTCSPIKRTCKIMVIYHINISEVIVHGVYMWSITSWKEGVIFTLRCNKRVILPPSTFEPSPTSSRHATKSLLFVIASRTLIFMVNFKTRMWVHKGDLHRHPLTISTLDPFGVTRNI